MIMFGFGKKKKSYGPMGKFEADYGVPSTSIGSRVSAKASNFLSKPIDIGGNVRKHATPKNYSRAKKAIRTGSDIAIAMFGDGSDLGFGGLGNEPRSRSKKKEEYDEVVTTTRTVRRRRK